MSIGFLFSFVNHFKELDKNLFFYDANAHVFFDNPEV